MTGRSKINNLILKKLFCHENSETKPIFNHMIWWKPPFWQWTDFAYLIQMIDGQICHDYFWLKFLIYLAMKQLRIIFKMCTFLQSFSMTVNTTGKLIVEIWPIGSIYKMPFIVACFSYVIRNLKFFEILNNIKKFLRDCDKASEYPSTVVS